MTLLCNTVAGADVINGCQMAEKYNDVTLSVHAGNNCSFTLNKENNTDGKKTIILEIKSKLNLAFFLNYV